MAEGTLRIHSENILPIIKKWLYSDKDIFIRELVSNSTDAIAKLLLIQSEEGIDIGNSPLEIRLKLNQEAKTLTISDTGIGMTAEEVEKYIAQLAFSGAEEFLEKYKNVEGKEPFIGHFGLGFYSAFMVSSLVEIDTLSYKEESAPAHWSCDGSSTYTLDVGSRKERGTSITLHIQDEEYLDPAKLLSILKTYCDFLPYPIYFEEEQINKDAPIWIHESKDLKEEDYLAFYHKLYPTEPDPIFWIHLNVDHPFHLKGVLYFPRITPRFDFQSSHIKLYCNRVFVSQNCKDLFPDFLTVLRGAIDSPDIPLNVSRSYLQMDSTVRKLAQHISKKISDRLTALYKEDKEKFIEYWPDMEVIVKLGILHDEKFYERVKDLLLWKTASDKWLTVEEYVEKYKAAYGEKVFYSTKDIEQSQFLSLYKEKNIEVLFAKGPLDNAIFNSLESKLSIRFQRVDGGIDDLILDKENIHNDALQIQEKIQKNLSLEGVEVQAKSLSSPSLPAFVMIDENSRRMREYLSMTQKEMPNIPFGKQVFVVNTNNSLIQSLLKIEESDPTLSASLTRQIYDLSLLSQQELHPDALPAFVSRMGDVLEKITTQLTKD
jgi:molecular chaperone HtpG